MLLFRKNAWLFDLAQTVLRSWWTFVAAVCFGLTGAMFALQHIPKKYEASTTIWISQPPQLPESVARTTVTEDMTRRLRTFRAAVLAQPYMIELIERTFGLPETEKELRALMSVLRARVTVAIGRHRRQGFNTFALTYRGDRNPQRAANVVNTLSKLYISQNEDFRARQAERTAETIASMAAEVKPEFDEIDRKLSEFRRIHRFETEADLATNQRLWDASLRELELMKSRRAVLEAKREGLEAQLMQAKLRVSGLTGTDPALGRVSINPRTLRLAELQRELDEMRIHYSELHPSYLKKKREIEELLRQARTEEPGEGEESQDSVAVVDPAVAPLQTEVGVVYQELEALDVGEARLRADIAEFQRRIEVAPEVQRQLNELSERHAYLRERYLRLQREAEDAEGSVDLEEDQLLGRRMEVLDWATVPTSPYAPQRLRAYVLGVAMGCLLFIGPLLARNLLNPVILSEEGFRALSDSPLLISIPNLLHNRGIVLRRFLKNLAFSALSAAVFVATKTFLIVD